MREAQFNRSIKALSRRDVCKPRRQRAPIEGQIMKDDMSRSKIDVSQAKKDLEESDALLVCAYDSQEKFAANHLQGALSLDELRSRESSLPKQQELIFYCA
jgi:hypothetical protein